MSKYQKVLQLWANAQGQTLADPDTLKYYCQTKEGWGEEFENLLASWVNDTLDNPPVPVPELDKKNKHDFLMVTDASKTGWSAIVISTSTGQSTVMGGDFPEEIQRYTKHSSIGEPLAVMAGARTFFEVFAECKVLHIGDNTGTTGEINKGYSTKTDRFLAEHLAKRYPSLEMTSDYYPGELIPTDEISRGKKLDVEKLKLLCDKYALQLGDIREYMF